jgi:ubiquinone biosynthesis monooxygenase Coq7
MAIYSAQLARAQRKYRDLVPWLEETLCHETRHRSAFRSAMDERGVTPCGALAIWSVGGSVLGASTAIFGRTGVYICTAAVERTLQRHLKEQAAYLDAADPALASIVRDILCEEEQHLAHAEHRHNASSFSAIALSNAVSFATEMLIWLSTQGASFGFKRDMRET